MGKVKRTLEEYVILTVATLILVVGVYVFKFPNNFSFGGVTGIAVVLSAVMPATPGNITFIINMVLLVVGFIFLGKSFGIRTVYVSVLMSVGLSLAEVWFPMEHPLTTQPVLELMYAIALPAFSAAIMFNIGASGGGTDIIAAIIHKYRDVTLGRMIMACDVIIISSCYFIFNDWRRVIFGFVTLFVIGIVLDYIVNGARQSVQFFIFSKDYEKIADRITKETHRGVTVLDGIGWYSKRNVKVLVVLAYKRQSVEIFRLVKDIDPNAFISQSSVIGVYGEGFDKLKGK